ncbi:3-hydroxyacyl-CoA dehydrogenase NAD-binding domain-containing protein [Roseovarius nanhaiticus]|uniref:3-hydroxyacyl-CoA dehydrogenase NAD-binding domain-containing protein n=1 Tax=Roseovarius nanhaiticus TaxID=573024 RepID=UPI0024913049|nr:3-hydroxyacyl-CoA dehydrogenase NAD-binding domain-containing protein [Roseovarius nanhaiticus]
MHYPHTACLGAGVIGASWAALFLASGRSVAIHDPAADAEREVRAYIETAWPTLTQMGLTANATPDAIRFCASAAEAATGAEFIQESVPERLEIKHALYSEIEPVLAPGAIVASSTSGLMLGDMQAGWHNPAPFVLGHPFNPPHLVPLVEVMGNHRTGAGVADAAAAFYDSIGKVTVRVQREVPGHIANRLQAAIWREAIHLVQEGVASVDDIDKAMWAGPGLRWAAMGPTACFDMGGGAGGLQTFCDRLGDQFNGWCDDLGNARLTPDTIAMMVAGAAEAAGGETREAMQTRRDAMITAMQAALKPYR